jgi:hypothetical protein
MEKDYYYPDDNHHYDVPTIDRFSHFYLRTEQKNEDSHYAKLDVNNPKTSPKYEPFEWMKQNKITFLLASLIILAILVVSIASKRRRKKNLTVKIMIFCRTVSVPYRIFSNSPLASHLCFFLNRS